MFASLASLIVPVLLALSALSAPSPRGPNDGQIIQPATGSVIAPGQSFDFLYDSYADYGRSSYNFTVWLLTGSVAQPPYPGVTPPTFPFGGNDLTGHFFGRFSYENYPGNPYPNNAAPATLVMPDFSKNHAGFGAGKTASNLPVWLAVIEEWASGEGVVGLRMHTTLNKLVYNGTIHA